jgi:hypothetical protein
MHSLTLDHVILVVSGLNAAIAQFSQLGFTVIPGGVHSGGLTHNALIPFADGTYLELLATTRASTFRTISFIKKMRLLDIYTANQTTIGRRLIGDLASGIGMNDYSLLSMDLNHEIASLHDRGTTITDPIPGGRMRPDGQEISWRTAVPQTIDLPFLIDDLTPRELRVPKATDDMHSNGIRGISGITILVSNLVESMAHYRALLGEEPKTQPRFPQPGTQASEFNLEARFLSLASPLPGSTSLRKFLKSRSSRPIGLFFSTTKSDRDEFLSLTYLPEKGATLSRSQVLLA